MDHHAGFATVHGTMIAAEAEMLAEADVVIATSAALERNARKYRDDVVLLRNACEPEHFAKTPRARNARALNAKPTIGFYGAIAECFDPALVAELAVRRPDWDFLLVGSAYGGDVSRLARLPNVTLPGEQPYESMPEWLGRFDVAIIPFRRTPLTEATNPVKVYEMLAGGKPVVSVPIPEVAALAPLVRLASTAEEFEREIAGALAGDTDAAADERRAFARRQTWELRFEVLAAAAANALARASVDGVVRRVRASRGAVIFPPSIGWYVDLVQRPHHLARAFARKGFTVIFDTSNAHDPVAGFEEIEPNLFLFAGDEELLTRIPEPLLWTLPYNFEAVDRHPPGTRTVYDWIDDLSVFGQDARFVERTHARGLREATLVTTVARTLRSAEREDALYLPNAVDCAHFAETREARLLDLPADGKPLAGYYGAIASWFDFDLLDDVARLRADWNFVLIGAALDASLTRHPLFSRANVLWLGPRMYATLPAYLHAFDAAMIPFAVNRITNATSPLKLYEYFAGGKPVIATPLPECAQFPEVTIAATATEFAAALDVARGRDDAFRARLRAIAAANSWDARVDAVLARLP
jgi:glycosyltransferase involved in cell wall biosynthesis